MADTEPTASTAETPNPGAWKAPTAHDLMEELKLGVSGHGTPADTERLAKATKALEDFEKESDRAYAAAKWPDEPWLVEPFGAKLLVRHGGNLSVVLTDPSLEKEVINAMGLDQYEQNVMDEDGGRRNGSIPRKRRKDAKRYRT